MDILVIGGTRNVGHFLVLELLQNGHRVTTLNRGKTNDELPRHVQRLHGDRSNMESLRAALGNTSFDSVIDMTLYRPIEAEAITSLLKGRTGHYLFLSTGQVYLVRQSTMRPFTEEQFDKPFIKSPPVRTRDYEEWLYGVEKSQAESILMRAWETRSFPFTTLRLPMVNSQRDHFHRIHNYLLRMQDGLPILLPIGDHLRLRHVYVQDVVQAITRIVEGQLGKGRVYNISQDETLSIEEFLELLASIAGYSLNLKYIPKETFESLEGFPNCSPFGDAWMSELDNQKSKAELGLRYTPVPDYLQKLVSYYRKSASQPEGYPRHSDELQWAAE